jgi:hypothetical protein
MDDFTIKDGILCSGGGHFTCDDDFSQYITNELETKRTGDIICPVIECAYQYADVEVATHAGEAFDSYQERKRQLVEQQLRVTIEAEARRKLEGQLQQIQRMTEEQREIDVARREIESMLELKCPQCTFVFDMQQIFDSRDCMALKCPNPECRRARGFQTQFCGWCWVDCNRDAHAHVGSCLHKPRGADVFYSNRAEYDTAQKTRLAAVVTEYVLNKPAQIRTKIVEACAKPLADNYNLQCVIDRFGGGEDPAITEDAAFAFALQLQEEEFGE